MSDPLGNAARKILDSVPPGTPQRPQPTQEKPGAVYRELGMGFILVGVSTFILLYGEPVFRAIMPTTTKITYEDAKLYFGLAAFGVGLLVYWWGRRKDNN